MLRVFKVTSPMSVGSWILFVSGGATTTAGALELSGRLGRLARFASAVSFLSGAPLATYTGALLANTANPAWSEGRDHLRGSSARAPLRAQALPRRSAPRRPPPRLHAGLPWRASWPNSF